MLQILREKFAELLTEGRVDDRPNGSSIITQNMLVNCLNLHRKVKEEIRAGNVGTEGGPFELNLRDLEKLRECVDPA